MTAASAPAAPSGALHSVACGIADETPSKTRLDGTSDSKLSHQILHVSGVAFCTAAHGGLSSEARSVLEAFRLSALGHHLEYTSKLLGQGGYAPVVKGKEVVPASSPSIFLAPVCSALHMINPWVATAKSLLAYLPFGLAFTALADMSQNVLKRRLHTAASAVGLALPTHEVSLPRAVKVLRYATTGGKAGAYGSRSVEHEVLITLHVSSACANCPFIGKAHAFEFSDKAQDATRGPCEVPPSTLDMDGPALLLALEPYTVDLRSAMRIRGLDVPAASALADLSAACHQHLDPMPEATSMGSSAEYNTLQVVSEDTDTSEEAVSLWEWLLWLKRNNMRLPLSEMKRIALQLATAVHELHHRAYVMHLDVKPQNVLLDSELNIKLVDFGLSAAFPPSRPFIEINLYGRGTPRYTCPEMIYNVPGIITPSADVYSLACCFMTLCSDHMAPCLKPEELLEPFYGCSKTDILLQLQHRRAPAVPASIPKPFRDIITKCIVADPGSRPSTLQIINDLTAIDVNSSDTLHTPMEDAAPVPSNEQFTPRIATVAPAPPAPPTIASVPIETMSSGDDPSDTPVSQACPRPTPGPSSPCRPSDEAVPRKASIIPQHQARYGSYDLAALCAGVSPQRSPWTMPVNTRISEGTSSSFYGSNSEALQGMNSSSISGVCGNTILPSDLGALPVQVASLSVVSKSVRGMRYTKSLRTGLAAVAPGSVSSITSLQSSGVHHASETHLSALVGPQVSVK